VLPKFFYVHTWNSQVWQQLLVLILLNITKNFHTTVEISIMGSSALASLSSFLAAFGEF
jgi:hypothetical protein